MLSGEDDSSGDCPLPFGGRVGFDPEERTEPGELAGRAVSIGAERQRLTAPAGAADHAARDSPGHSRDSHFGEPGKGLCQRLRRGNGRRVDLLAADFVLDVPGVRRFDASVGGEDVQGMLFEQRDHDGRIADAMLTIRPYPGLRAAMGEMQARLATAPLPSTAEAP